MTSNKQVAGAESTQIQAQSIIINQGITETRAREIVDEQMAIFARQYSIEAQELAIERSGKLQEQLFERIRQRDMELLSSLKDPGCQFLLQAAAKAAASTDRESDYEILSELLIHRFERNGNPHVRAGVNRAVEIVDQVTDKELLGLTVAMAVSALIPTSGDIRNGLSTLNDLYGKLLIGDLPQDDEWIANLDILNACRPLYYQCVIPYKKRLHEMLPGYFIEGIPANSEQHEEAVQLLQEHGLSPSFLTPHELNEGYLRLPVRDEEHISNLKLISTRDDGSHAISNSTPSQTECLTKIFEMSKGAANDEIDNKLDEVLGEYPSILAVSNWWDSLKIAIRITPCGKALAHANAKRTYQGLPPLN